MAKWKLSRQHFEPEELEFSEGQEVTIGRGLSNTVTLSSIVVSRYHCVIYFKDDKAVITDLKSSNGVYIGLKKINPNTPYDLLDSDIIGFGWTPGAPLAVIPDNEKYVYKLIKVKIHTPIYSRIQFQNEQDLNDDIEETLEKLHDAKSDTKATSINNSKQILKRKLSIDKVNNVVNKKIDDIINVDGECISISDSDLEICTNKETINKKTKLEPLTENNKIGDDHITIENDEIQSEAFKVKQEYLGYDDEPIQISSDDDSESEQWLIRLSQSSPGKPFTKIVRNKDTKPSDNSYSQCEDFIILDTKVENNELEEEFNNNKVRIPSPSVEVDKGQKNIGESFPKITEKCSAIDTQAKSNDTNLRTNGDLNITNSEWRQGIRDEIDGAIVNENYFHQSASCKSLQTNQEITKKIKLIEPAYQHTTHSAVVSKKECVNQKNKTIKRCTSRKQNTKIKQQVKKLITDAQKEERKQKLKEIALKGKGETKLPNASSINTSIKPSFIAKVTNLNRGVFLTGNVESAVDSLRNVDTTEDTSQTRKSKTESKIENQNKKEESKKHILMKHELLNIKNKDENTKNCKINEYAHCKTKVENDSTKSSHVSDKLCGSDVPISIRYVKPLKGIDDSKTGKPFSKVLPMSSKLTSESVDKKTKKRVRFTDKEPEVLEFEIEPGNQMKRTSSIKNTLLDARYMPMFSLEKRTLMKILHWNANWLEEQLHNDDPPPILGDDNSPLVIFHSFTNHNQYIQLIGDLLLMEIWECLTQGYKRLPKENVGLQMQIDSLPPVPHDRYFDMYNISVNLSLPTTEVKFVPRVGDVLLATFGVDSTKFNKLIFVNNVRCLPSPPHNIHSFYAISLCCTFSEKIVLLRPGQKLYCKNLAYIKNELMLFEAMEYLAGSPLSESILKPAPHHFINLNELKPEDLKSQWTVTLNPSQKLAVCSSVSAALGDRPGIQMVQGPPGTGKTSVICAIVMTYFYNAVGKRQQNRGKILICATSNAAVDELVIRLLKIRKNMPKEERFRMVRVGRAESMHPRAFEVSSLRLAQRDASRLREKPTEPGVAEEISHIEAKINMLRTQIVDQADPSRIAYCETRIASLNNRITLLRGDNGKAPRAEQLQHVERRIIDGADIVLTTLTSTHNHKMRCLKRRIALCIVDEAGQAIEPETLIPLTLDVTRVTLIGDPQQLPGFICSQRARKHGLGESLFSRLSNCTEHWTGSPVVLLNEQYRMHPDIADYPNRAFYEGKIQTVTSPSADLNIPPYCIINIPSGDKGQGASGANEVEAWGVARLSLALQASLRGKDFKLAVITPYSAQRDLIRRFLKILQDPSEGQVEVNTVDSFQGQERDVVVVSLARSSGVGFLTDAGRMNVMLTRAKHALLVCLNPHAMMKNMQWRTLVEDAQRRKLYTTLPSRMCQGPSGASIPHGQILSHIMQLKNR